MFAPFSFAAKFVDPQTGYKLKFESLIPVDVLELVAKKLYTEKSFFQTATIHQFNRVGPDAFFVRTSSYSLLVQTDLKRVDSFRGDLMNVWNDILIFKINRRIVTVDRRDFRTIQELDLSVVGEGVETWSHKDLGGALSLKIRWTPDYSSLISQGACLAILTVANPLTAMPPYPEEFLAYTSEQTFYFSISPDGSISISKASDSVKGRF